MYNYEGRKISLTTKLNTPFCRFMVSDYQDVEICEFLEYSFTIDFSGKVQYTNTKVKTTGGSQEFLWKSKDN